jgi:hypothetical protein
LMNFLPRLDRRKKIRAQSHRDEQKSDVQGILTP